MGAACSEGMWMGNRPVCFISSFRQGLDEKKLSKIRKKQSSFHKTAEKHGGNSLEIQKLQFKIGAYCSALF